MYGADFKKKCCFFLLSCLESSFKTLYEKVFFLIDLGLGVIRCFPMFLKFSFLLVSQVLLKFKGWSKVKVYEKKLCGSGGGRKEQVAGEIGVG